MKRAELALAAALLLVLSSGARAQPSVVKLWPGRAPGSENWKQEELQAATNAGFRSFRNVVDPSMTAYLPAQATATGAAAIVAPDGAFRLLAFDTEGTTVAELGSGNKPLSMFVYEKGGKDYILVANNNRGVMKIPTEGIDTIAGITNPVGINKTAGLQYETIKELKKVEKLARLDRDHAVILAKADTPEGSLYLKAIALP